MQRKFQVGVLQGCCGSSQVEYFEERISGNAKPVMSYQHIVQRVMATVSYPKESDQNGIVVCIQDDVSVEVLSYRKMELELQRTLSRTVDLLQFPRQQITLTVWLQQGLLQRSIILNACILALMDGGYPLINPMIAIQQEDSQYIYSVKDFECLNVRSSKPAVMVDDQAQEIWQYIKNVVTQTS